MAQAEDKDLPEDEMSSSEEITLMKKYWGFSPKGSGKCAEDENFLGRA